jgi:hypothetical protein
MVPIGNKNKVEDVGGVDSNKRPALYSFPQKANWIALLNSSSGQNNVSQKVLRPVELKVTNNNHHQLPALPLHQKAISPTSSESPGTPPVKAFPVPLPRMNSSSSSSSSSEPKTPVPLPRTKFNLPAIDTTSLVLERSASLSETTEKKHPVKSLLSHSISDPTPSIRQWKMYNKTVNSALPDVPESSTAATIDSTPQDEEDGIDTWL